MRNTKQVDLRRALALASAFSFLLSCSRSSLLPFLTLYFRQLGLSPSMTGLIVGARHLVALLWAPLAALLSRYYNKRRAVIICSLALSAAAALLLLRLPPVDPPNFLNCNTSVPEESSTEIPSSTRHLTSPEPHPATTTRAGIAVTSQTGVNVSAATLPPAPLYNITDRSLTHPPLLNTTESVSGELLPNTTLPNSPTKSVPPTPSRKKRSVEVGDGLDFLSRLKNLDSRSQLFILVLLIVGVWELLAAPLDWVVDDGLFEYLDSADAADRQGARELWSLLGAAAGAGAAGVLVSRLSCITGAAHSAALFYQYAGLAVVALLVGGRHPLHLNKKRQRAGGLLKALRLVQGSTRALLCAVTVFLAGAAGSAAENFLLWQIQDRGGGELHMGLTLAVAPLSHAAFPLLTRPLSRLLSPARVLVVGAASLALQLFYFSFLWGGWAALPAQLLCCLSCGALWWAVGVHCEDLATPGAERSVRRVFTSVALHLGGAVGSAAGGFAAQTAGLPWLFRGAALGLMAWCVCLPVLQWKAPHQRRINYSRLLAADGSDRSDSESEAEGDWLDRAMKDDWTVKHGGGSVR